jgi:hypothetical protein
MSLYRALRRRQHILKPSKARLKWIVPLSRSSGVGDRICRTALAYVTNEQSYTSRHRKCHSRIVDMALDRLDFLGHPGQGLKYPTTAMDKQVGKHLFMNSSMSKPLLRPRVLAALPLSGFVPIGTCRHSLLPDCPTPYRNKNRTTPLVSGEYAAQYRGAVLF